MNTQPMNNQWKQLQFSSVMGVLQEPNYTQKTQVILIKDSFSNIKPTNLSNYETLLYGDLLIVNTKQEFEEDNCYQVMNKCFSQYPLFDKKSITDQSILRFFLCVYTDLKHHIISYRYAFNTISSPSSQFCYQHISPSPYIHDLSTPSLQDHSIKYKSSTTPLQDHSIKYNSSPPSLQDHYIKHNSSTTLLQDTSINHNSSFPFPLEHHFISHNTKPYSAVYMLIENTMNSACYISLPSISQQLFTYFQSIHKEQNSVPYPLQFVFLDGGSKEYPSPLLLNFLYYIQYLLSTYIYDPSYVLYITIQFLRVHNTSHEYNRVNIYIPWCEQQLFQTPCFFSFSSSTSSSSTVSTVDLSKYIQSNSISQNSITLNLKLMKWRVYPELDMDTLCSMRCFLIGAGALGCSVARALMAWGVSSMILLDHARISASNPIRQSLYTFKDIQSNQYKSILALESLKAISPSLSASALTFSIPLPFKETKQFLHSEQFFKQFLQLCLAIDQSDVVFLLTDTRESRYLPTILCSLANKKCISIALGNDDMLVMKYGERNIQNNDSINILDSLRGISSSSNSIDNPLYMNNHVNMSNTPSLSSLSTSISLYSFFYPSIYEQYPNISTEFPPPSYIYSLASSISSPSSLHEKYHHKVHREDTILRSLSPSPLLRPYISVNNREKDTIISLPLPPPSSPHSACYFCSDVVVPRDSSQYLSMDQSCTITRPGLASIAAGIGVELYISSIHEINTLPKQVEKQKSSDRTINNENNISSSTLSNEEENSIKQGYLGNIPDSIRFFLSSYSLCPQQSSSYSHCSACSESIQQDLYNNRINSIQCILCEDGYVESVVGLDSLKKKMDTLFSIPDNQYIMNSQNNMDNEEFELV
ncbi:hypothetical protein WA158_002031 [Blastocystis sp. Blastoise]